jgi:myotubularin-related protein 1/2
MRDSLTRLRDYVDAHGSISSNGTPSAVSVVGDRVCGWLFQRFKGFDFYQILCLQAFQEQYETREVLYFIFSLVQRNRGSTWGGGNLNSMTSFSSTLGEWLNHIQNILVGASWIAAQIAVESASVLVHCRFISPISILNLY